MTALLTDVKQRILSVDYVERVCCLLVLNLVSSLHLCLTPTARNLRDKPKPQPLCCAPPRGPPAVTALVFIVSARSNKDTLITTQRPCQSQRALDAVLDSFLWTPFCRQKPLLPRASSSWQHTHGTTRSTAHPRP